MGWQSETVTFMLKQHTGKALTARTYHTRRRELALRCVTHNVRIVYGEKGFLQATPNAFCRPRPVHVLWLECDSDNLPFGILINGYRKLGTIARRSHC